MSRILCDYVNKTRGEEKRGVVVGFPRFKEDALRSMKEDLGLSMTISELRFCRKAYNTPEYSAPTLDEIYFLDAVANGLHRSNDFASVARLQLYHSEAVRTYRDLLEKRTLLAGHPSADVPSFEELSELLTRVLLRSGKHSDLGRDISVIADPSEALTAAAAGLTPIETLSVDASLPSVHLFSGYSGFDSKATSAEEDDAILLLRCPTEECLDTEADPFSSPLIRRVSLFAKSPVYQENVHAYRAVDHRGIAVGLVSLYDGIYTELDTIPSVFDGGELYDLALCEHGSLLVAIPRQNAEGFIEEAERYGILATRIARAVKGNRLIVRKEGHAPYSFQTSFLRAFSALHVPFLLEGGNAPQNTSKPLHSVVCGAGATDLAERESGPMSAVALSSGLCSAAGSRTLSFDEGLDVALLAVLEAILSGAELSRLSISDVYVYPEKITSLSLGGLFEAFLGVYRVLAELAIPNRSTFLPFSEQGAARSGMAVYCFDRSEKVRTELFTTHGAGVYLIALPKNEGGFYDFSGVRSLLHLLLELRKNHQILSARIGVRQAPREIIEKMCDACTVQYDAVVSESDLEGRFNGIFVVLEASSEIQSLKRIASVQKILKKI